MSVLKIKDGNDNWVEIPTIKGEDGKSAYEYAVDGGYTGTESEFTEKLAEEYVKPTDWATDSAGGIVKIASGGGISIDSNHGIQTTLATGNQIKVGEEGNRPIVPYNQHQSTFYGLAKAAGDTTQTLSNNAVGAYTDNAKTAIKSMLGVPTNSYDLNLGTAIPTNANLNTYTTVGTYNADSTVVGSISNAPIYIVPYKLIVESIDDTIIRQIVITSSDVYQRIGDSSSSSWVFSDWVKYITSADFCTQAEIEEMLSANGFDSIIIEDSRENSVD